MWIKQLCDRKVRDFTMALRARKVSGALEKRAPGHFPRRLEVVILRTVAFLWKIEIDVVVVAVLYS